MNKYLYIVIFCICFSCNSKRKAENNEMYLSGKSYKFDESILLKYPYKIQVIDSILIVWDLHSKDNFFHVFSFKDSVSKYLYSFGKLGQGPGELTACSGLELQDGCLSFFDTNKAILYSYSIENIEKNIGKPIKSVQFPKDYVPVIQSTKMGKKGNIILESKGECRFILFDNEGNILEKCYKIPNNENKDVPNFMLQQLWSSCLSFNETNNILVLGTKLGDVLEIYNFNEKTAKIVVGNQGEPSFFRDGKSVALMQANGYQDVIVGDYNIYALYSSISQKEVIESKKNGKIVPKGGNIIYVFSLDGEIKTKFILDKYINNFYIDFEKKIIYGVNPNSDIQLCIFNLPMI